MFCSGQYFLLGLGLYLEENATWCCLKGGLNVKGCSRNSPWGGGGQQTLVCPEGGGIFK